MRRYLDDDVATRVRRHGRARAMSDRIVSTTGLLAIEELTSRISSADISTVLKHLETGFDPELDTSARRRAIGQEFAAARKEKRDPHPLVQQFYGRPGGPPADVVLATSMLQVGVDVSRFGLMVVTGQPKNTAEYIQASSRVGRSVGKPGLVVTLYNWSRPRDLAHYEDFEHYHATYYRQVEALSVTPYTRRALDRGTAATFVAAVRNVIEPYSRRRRRPGRRSRRRGGAGGRCPANVAGRARLRFPWPRVFFRTDRCASRSLGAFQVGVDQAGLPETGGQTTAQRAARRAGRRLVDAADGADVDARDRERGQPASPRQGPVRSGLRPARLVVRRARRTRIW